MALNFGPQWLRDLSDAGSGNPGSPTTPTGSVKFKLADYRYGREEMLSLFTESSPPPDQVRKHLTIFSKEIQKPITMMPLTEDEQRLTSQGYNSTQVLRAAGRASGPPPRVTRGGGSMDRGRGRGRGRGEGYVPRTMENGDVGYSRSAQDGWEQVGRKFERSFSGGAYEEGASTKREFPTTRSSRDNWRDKRAEEGEEEEPPQQQGQGSAQAGWRGPSSRWSGTGPAGSSRTNWRDAREAGFGDGDRRQPSQGRRGFDHDTRGPRRISESADNDEVPEWVEDDIEDDPGTFDSKGVFVSTKESRSKDNRYEPPHQKQTNKKSEAHSEPDDVNKKSDRGSSSNSTKQTYVPPHKQQQNGLNTSKERVRPPSEHQKSPTLDLKDRPDSTDSQNAKARDTENHRGRPDSIDLQKTPPSQQNAQKDDGDSGFAFPTKVSDGTKAPPGQYLNQENEKGVEEMLPSSQRSDVAMPEPDTFSLADKTLQNLVAEMTAENERKFENKDVSQALSINHENAYKWFYRDPQGEVQGPFSNDDMANWFSAGYFTMSLIVKRGCDDSYKQLGELIKRYGRVPFLPGPELPPLVTSSAAPEIPSPVPPLMSPMAGIAPILPGMQDPLMYRQLLLQQEYLKQTIYLRQLHTQNLLQVQETESFKALSPDQQNQLAMQMTMQGNPVAMQHIHNLQQQQLLTQQQKLSEHQQMVQQPDSPGQQSLPSLSNIPISSADSSTSTPTAAEVDDESAALWGMPVSQAQSHTAAGWTQPNSLWDVSPSAEGLPPVYQAQIERIKKERDEARLKDVSRARQEELDRKKEELRRQQEELEKQQEQMRKEKEELERQNMLEMQKLEEARRKEEERIHKQEEERLRRQQEEQQRKQQELERQKKELEDQKRRKEEERRRQEEERRRQEEEMRRQEEEKRRQEEEQIRRQEEEKRKREEMKRQEEEERKRREREQQLQLQKLEEKKRIESNKKKQIEEQKRHMEELRKREEQRQQQEEMARLQEQQRKEEERLRNDSSERERLREESEYERMRQEAEREEIEANKRQQAEIMRQQESLRRLQQAQQAQLANIQLPAASNWAANQSSPVKSKSRSLMDIQAEEARREQEREYEKQSQMQQIQEQQSYLMMTQQNQQKSWSSLASQGVPKGPSLLDIQKQEQENSRKSYGKESNPNSYQAKLSKLSSGSTWSSPLSSQSMWSSPSWDQSVGNAPTATIWDQPLTTQRTQPAPQQNKKSNVQSGEFPALRNPAQSGGNKNQKSKAAKTSKNKKEEETVQKLFQQPQKQDSFSDWVAQRVTQFSANVDVPTFVSFIIDVENPDDIKEYMKMYLGDSRESGDFARQFIEKRSKFRNKQRLEKQQEEDSIWGPAAAVNPYMPNRGGQTVQDENTTKSKKSKKKTKMQKLDVSALGFTVHSDPNRKNAAGELESVQ